MNLKKILVLSAVAIVLFLLITEPEQSAEAVLAVLGWIGVAINALIRFIRRLFA
ncbi:MAG TPA: hypothetical protein VFZ48_00750 [Candidatus Saccharimonadales bacterium]